MPQVEIGGAHCTVMHDAHLDALSWYRFNWPGALVALSFYLSAPPSPPSPVIPQALEGYIFQSLPLLHARVHHRLLPSLLRALEN